MSIHFQEVPTHRRWFEGSSLLLPGFVSCNLCHHLQWSPEERETCLQCLLMSQGGKLSRRVGLWCGLKGRSRKGMLLPAGSSALHDLQARHLLSLFSQLANWLDHTHAHIHLHRTNNINAQSQPQWGREYFPNTDSDFLRSFVLLSKSQDYREVFASFHFFPSLLPNCTLLDSQEQGKSQM